MKKFIYHISEKRLIQVMADGTTRREITGEVAREKAFEYINKGYAQFDGSNDEIRIKVPGRKVNPGKIFLSVYLLPASVFFIIGDLIQYIQSALLLLPFALFSTEKAMNELKERGVDVLNNIKSRFQY